MEHIPSDSIHLTFTSPPYYNARAYAQYPTYEAYLGFLDDVFSQIHRITKEGRFLIVNTSPIVDFTNKEKGTGSRLGIPFDLHSRLQAMGWDFVDDIVWQKPEWTNRNRNRNFQFAKHRKPLSYKPNSVSEYLMVYRKKTDKPIRWNMEQYSPRQIEQSKVEGDFESSNVWNITPASHPLHSAIFPSKLAQKVIQYYSLKGDLIFDPFGGSGTVAKVAATLDRPFLLVEKDPTYFQYMKSKAKTAFKKGKARFLNFKSFLRQLQDAQMVPDETQ